MANRSEATDRADILIGGSDHDTVDAGSGGDIVTGGGGRDTLNGGADRDVVLGGSGDDVVGGGGGRDYIRGGSGEDVLAGGAEGDFLRGDTGSDLLAGDGGDDRLWGDEGNDTLRGGEGNDILVGGPGDDLMIGGAGADTFLYIAESGDDLIYHFEPGTDRIDLRLLPRAVAFSDLVIVGMEDGSGVRITHETLDGSIEIRGIAASDLSESDFALPDGTTTFIHIGGATVGRPSDPFLGSESSSVMLDNADGNRTLARGGHDRVFGGEGDDRIEGGKGFDDLYGEEGGDILEGGEGNDRLFGGEGDDGLDGGSGDDWLHGGEGDDVLKGGADADAFVFGSDHGIDTVMDFADGEDRIDLSAFAGLSEFGELHITADETAAIIDLTSYGGGIVRLDDVRVDDLDALDFVFHEPPAAAPAIDGM